MKRLGGGSWRLEMRLGPVLGYGNAFWGRVRAGVLGGRGTPPPPLQAIPWGWGAMGDRAPSPSRPTCHTGQCRGPSGGQPIGHTIDPKPGAWGQVLGRPRGRRGGAGVGGGLSAASGRASPPIPSPGGSGGCVGEGRCVRVPAAVLVPIMKPPHVGGGGGANIPRDTVPWFPPPNSPRGLRCPVGLPRTARAPPSQPRVPHNDTPLQPRISDANKREGGRVVPSPPPPPCPVHKSTPAGTGLHPLHPCPRGDSGTVHLYPATCPRIASPPATPSPASHAGWRTAVHPCAWDTHPHNTDPVFLIFFNFFYFFAIPDMYGYACICTTGGSAVQF